MPTLTILQQYASMSERTCIHVDVCMHAAHEYVRHSSQGSSFLCALILTPVTIAPGIIAAAAATIVTQPADVIRARMQLNLARGSGSIGAMSHILGRQVLGNPKGEWQGHSNMMK